MTGDWSARASQTGALLARDPVVVELPQSDTPVLVAVLSLAGAQWMFRDGYDSLIERLARDYSVASLQTSSSAEWLFVTAAEANLLESGEAAQADIPVTPEHRRNPGKLPAILWSSVEPTTAEYLLQVLPGLSWFAGHFPEQPVLPGVVQIDWAMLFAADLRFKAADFCGIPRVKFNAVILPDYILRLSLTKTAHGLRFVFASNRGVHSQGLIGFG
jgi:hypothetical protein